VHARVGVDPRLAQDAARRGAADPEDVGKADPWRCLWRGFFLQMMRITPRRRTTLQCSQIGFTLARTFMFASLYPE
jgi:hypothetical protein